MAQLRMPREKPAILQPEKGHEQSTPALASDSDFFPEAGSGQEPPIPLLAGGVAGATSCQVEAGKHHVAPRQGPDFGFICSLL